MIQPLKIALIHGTAIDKVVLVIKGYAVGPVAPANNAWHVIPRVARDDVSVSSYQNYKFILPFD